MRAASTAAFFAPLLGTGDPLALNPMQRLRPPGDANWLGTDQFGRDLLTRLAAAGRVSLAITGAAMLWILGPELLTQPWLVVALGLYAANLVVAASPEARGRPYVGTRAGSPLAHRPATRRGGVCFDTLYFAGVAVGRPRQRDTPREGKKLNFPARGASSGSSRRCAAGSSPSAGSRGCRGSAGRSRAPSGPT